MLASEPVSAAVYLFGDILRLTPGGGWSVEYECGCYAKDADEVHDFMTEYSDIAVPMLQAMQFCGDYQEGRRIVMDQHGLTITDTCPCALQECSECLDCFAFADFGDGGVRICKPNLDLEADSEDDCE